MMCAVIEDLLPASYFSATLLGIQTDQRVLRHLIVQYLPRLDKLLQEHDIGRSQHQSSRGPDALAQGPGLLDTTSRGQGSWPPWLGGSSSSDSGRAVGPACNLHCPGPQCSLRLCLLSPLGVGKASCLLGEPPSASPPAHAPQAVRSRLSPVPAAGAPSVPAELSLITLHWFLTAFASVVHIRPLLRLWDLFFYEGSLVLFQAALGMLRLKVPRHLLPRGGEPCGPDPAVLAPLWGLQGSSLQCCGLSIGPTERFLGRGTPGTRGLLVPSLIGEVTHA